MGIINSEEDRRQKYMADRQSDRDRAIRQLIKAVRDLRDYVAIRNPPSFDDRLIGLVDIALENAQEAVDG